MGKSKKSDSPVSDNEERSEDGSEDEWLEIAIDLLASEYHWSKTEILEKVYLDELFIYQKKIKERKVLGYKMQLAIAQNPHLADEDERRAIWDMLDAQLDDGVRELETQPELDRGGMEHLKMVMSSNPRIVVK